MCVTLLLLKKSSFSNICSKYARADDTKEQQIPILKGNMWETFKCVHTHII